MPKKTPSKASSVSSPPRRRAGRAGAARSPAAIDVRIAHSLMHVQKSPAAARWILCPWQSRFSGEQGMWLSVLAAHDANQALLSALPASKKIWPHVYAAVFAVDLLRTADQLIRRIKDAGVGGVINLPSASFIDGAAGAVLEELSLGVTRELEFLEHCARQGLRIAGVVGSELSAQRLVKAGAEFLIVHGGPPGSGDEGRIDDLSTKLAAHGQTAPVPMVSLSKLFE